MRETRTLVLGILLAFVVAVVGFTLPVEAQDQPAKPVLPELLKLKADNFLLRATNLNLQRQSIEAQLKDATAALEKDRVALEADILKELKAAPGSTWDWPSMTVKPPEKPAESPAKK